MTNSDSLGRSNDTFDLDDPFFRNVMRHVDDVVMITEAEPIDDPGPRIVFVNEAFTRMTGYTAQEAVGRTPRMLQGPRTGRAELDRIRTALRKWQPVRAELLNYRKDGTEFWVEVQVAPITDPNGWYTHWVAIQRDITSRKGMEAKLLQTQKLESLGMLAGGVAHDFNNLLVGMLGNAGLAKMHLGDPTRAERHLERVVASAQRAADLCQQMLAYVGRGEARFTQVNLSLVVQEMLDLAEASLPKRARIDCELASQLPSFQGDVVQIQQVLLNLLTNAAESMEPTGGAIRVRTSSNFLSEEDLARGYFPDQLSPGRYVLLAVRDEGCGMDEATCSRLFDPFFTTKFTGRGLGLASVQGIVRQHRAALFLESTPGQGTRIVVAFPTIEAPDDRSNNDQPTILLIDDEEVVIEVASEILATAGFRIRTAVEGASAVSLFRTEGDSIQLAIVDLTMPGMQGIDCVAALRGIRGNLPIILSSGFSHREVERFLQENPEVRFLQKPYRPSQLLDLVRELLGQRPERIET